MRTPTFGGNSDNSAAYNIPFDANDQLNFDAFDSSMNQNNNYCFKNELLTPLSEFFKQYEANPEIIGPPLNEYTCVDFLVRLLKDKKGGRHSKCDAIAFGAACESCHRANDNIPINYAVDVSKRLEPGKFKPSDKRSLYPIFLETLPDGAHALAVAIGSLKKKEHIIDAIRAIHKEHFAEALSALLFDEQSVTQVLRSKIITTLKYVAATQIDPNMRVIAEMSSGEKKILTLDNFCLYDVRYLAYYLPSTATCTVDPYAAQVIYAAPAAIMMAPFNLATLLKKDQIVNKLRFNFSTYRPNTYAEGETIPFLAFMVRGPVLAAPPTEKVVYQTKEQMKRDGLSDMHLVSETERALLSAVADAVYNEAKTIVINQGGNQIRMDLEKYNPINVVTHPAIESS